MNKTAKVLNRISSYSFILALVASKIQYLPATIATPLLNIASIGLYLLGYSFWLAGSYFYPDQTPKYSEWYGFARFNEQNTYAAALGIFATLTGIVALALPLFALPASWIFLASNAIWAIGEYHKYKNPPQDENYSASYQKSYVSYALSMMSVSAVGALATTLMFCFPAFYLPLLIVSTLVTIGLFATAASYWLGTTFNEHKKTPVAKPSYEAISDDLGPSLAPEKTLTADPKPYHGKSPLKSINKHTPEIELVSIQPSASISCQG